MARRGKFGRAGAGTTQNLSVVIYRLLKQQMDDEMSAILTSYNTNMKDGRYTAQFNGQNVDGEFVLQYYRNMLAGFPPGSTEYETLSSQMASFESRYRTDVQNLVIGAMNDGTQIDFGLLGAEFANRGISEVRLTDIESWATQEIADLEANGDTVQADKLKGVVFTAKFDVLNDGKVAGVNSGDISRGAYNSWLKGQLQSALDAGFTKDSKEYRTILGLQAQAASEAKTQGQVDARDNYTKQMKDIQRSMNAAAEKLIQSYADSGNPAMLDAINEALASTQTSYPALELLQTFAAASGENSGYMGVYADIIQNADPNVLSDFYAATLTGQQDLTTMSASGFADAGDYADGLAADLLRLKSTNGTFVKNSGMEFGIAYGGNAMDDLRTNLAGAGVMFTGEGTTLNATGGHPDAVLQALRMFGTTIKDQDLSNFNWVGDLSNGEFPASLVAGTNITDIDKSGTISQQEIITAIENGKISYDDFTNIQTKAATMADKTLDMPTLGGTAMINPKSIVNTLLNTAWSKHVLNNGGQVMIKPNGEVVAFEGTAPAGGVPAVISTGGMTYGGIAMPVNINEKGTEQSPVDWAKNTGMTIQVFNTGGNTSTGYNGAKDTMFVRIVGQINGVNGAAANGILIPYKDFKRWMSNVVGVDLNDSSLINSQSGNVPNIFIDSTAAFDAKGKNFNDFFKNIFNPADPAFIGRSSTGVGAGIMNIGENDVNKYQYAGFIADPKSTADAIELSFARGKDRILADALLIAAQAGRDKPIQSDILKAVYKGIPGIPGTYDIDTSITKFGQYGDITKRISDMFGDTVPTAFVPQTPGGAAGLGMGQGFFSPSNPDYNNAPIFNTTPKPTPAAPRGGAAGLGMGQGFYGPENAGTGNGLDLSGIGDFIGGAFRNLGDFFNPSKPTTPKPASPAPAAPAPTTPSPAPSGGSSFNPSKPKPYSPTDRRGV
jgi:hypothetical protein